jgi:4-hydroxy-3-methylbut-2-enyl diphosphate reductase
MPCLSGALTGWALQQPGKNMLDEIIIVSPRGFCAGVERAVKIVEYALEQYPPPLFCRREIVHNQMVVNELREKGVAFVEELAEVPEGATVIFSAHGVPPSVHAEARQRQLHVIDATCPFVIKVHNEVKRFAREGYRILLIGHATHDEIVGIVGEAPEHVTVLQGVADAAAVQVEDPDKVAVMTQTTLSVNETEGVLSLLRQRFPRLQVPSKSDICYATHNRQFAARRPTAPIPIDWRKWCGRPASRRH